MCLGAISAPNGVNCLIKKVRKKNKSCISKMTEIHKEKKSHTGSDVSIKQLRRNIRPYHD